MGWPRHLRLWGKLFGGNLLGTGNVPAPGTTIPMCPVQVEGPLGPETVHLGISFSVAPVLVVVSIHTSGIPPQDIDHYLGTS